MTDEANRGFTDDSEPLPPGTRRSPLLSPPRSPRHTSVNVARSAGGDAGLLSQVGSPMVARKGPPQMGILSVVDIWTLPRRDQLGFESQGAGDLTAPRSSFFFFKTGRTDELDVRSSQSLGHGKGSLRFSPAATAALLLQLAVVCWWGLFAGGLPHSPQTTVQSWTSSLSQVHLLREGTLTGPAWPSSHHSWERAMWCELGSWGHLCDHEGSGGGAFPPDWGTPTASATSLLLKIKYYSLIVRIIP